MGDPPEASPSRRTILAALAVAATAVVIAWFGSWMLLNDLDDRGTWGDMFGGVNALFSGLAFVGVVGAILFQIHELSMQREELQLQRDELQLQRRELELTREEIAGQREEMVQQNATLRKQLYESSFLELLSQFRGVAASVGWTPNPMQTHVDTGATAFQWIADRVENAIRDRDPVEGHLEMAFDDLAQHWAAASLWSHFGFLAVLFEWIADAPEADRRRYQVLLRSQMSPSEQSMAVAWALVPKGEGLAVAATKADGGFAGFQVLEPLKELAGKHLTGALMGG